MDIVRDPVCVELIKWQKAETFLTSADFTGFSAGNVWRIISFILHASQGRGYVLTHSPVPSLGGCVFF